MTRKFHERPGQLSKIWFRLHDWSHHYLFLTGDDLCHFGSWPSEFLEVLAGLVSQTRFKLVDVVAVASELVFFNIYSGQEEAMQL